MKGKERTGLVHPSVPIFAEICNLVLAYRAKMVKGKRGKGKGEMGKGEGESEEGKEEKGKRKGERRSTAYRSCFYHYVYAGKRVSNKVPFSEGFGP